MAKSGHITIFLRTALFSAPSDNAHLPAGVAIIDGELLGPIAPGPLGVKTEAYRDSRDRALECSSSNLIIPWSKIDHVLLRD